MACNPQYLSAKRVLLIDCHNIPETDRRIISFMNALQDAITLTRRLAEPNWTYFGLTVFKESKVEILLSIQPWKCIQTNVLAKVFDQVQNLLLEEIEETSLVKHFKKEHLLKGLESASRQLKKVKTQGTLNEIVVITFNWENDYNNSLKLQFEELVQSDTSLLIRVIDLSCNIRASSTIERLYTHSFQPLNFDLEVESLLKSWASVKRKKVSIAFAGAQKKLFGEMANLYIDPHLQEFEDDTKSELSLEVVGTISGTRLSLKDLHGNCRILSHGNYRSHVEGWKTVWQYLVESQLVLIASKQSVNSFLLLPGQDYSLLLQPFIHDQAIVDSKIPEVIELPHEEAIVPELPLITEFGAGKKSGLIL